MEKATNIFLIGVILLGTALLRVLEILIHRTIPLWILFMFGIFACFYGIIDYARKRPPKDKK
jgi:hypothetical protein